MKKLSKTTRQNVMLLALTGGAFAIAKAGFDELLLTGANGLGMFPLLIGGLVTLISGVALFIRLWDME